MPCLAVLVLIFLGALWIRLRAAAEWLAVIAVGAGVLVAGFLLGAGAGISIFSVTAADFRDVDAARFLLVMSWEMVRLLVAPFLALIGASTLAGFRYGAFGKAFNIFSLVFTLVLLLGVFPSSPAGLSGLLAMFWLVVAGLLLAFRRGPEDRTPAQRGRRHGTKGEG